MLLTVACYEHICSHFLNFAQWETKGKHGTPVLVARRTSNFLSKALVAVTLCRRPGPWRVQVIRRCKLEKPKVGRVKQEGVTKRKKLDPPKRGSARPEFQAEFDLVFKDACRAFDKQREAAAEEEALFGE